MVETSERLAEVSPRADSLNVVQEFPPGVGTSNFESGLSVPDVVSQSPSQSLSVEGPRAFACP